MTRKEKMKALLINPESQTIESIQIDGHDDIIRLVGYDTVTSDEINADGDRLFFDEECFLRGTKGRFQIDNLIPVSGKAVIAGTCDDGASLSDVESSNDNISARIRYL
jgi:hypothetical protein